MRTVRSKIFEKNTSQPSSKIFFAENSSLKMKYTYGVYTFLYFSVFFQMNFEKTHKLLNCRILTIFSIISETEKIN
jgi:hypothetical protein